MTLRSGITTGTCAAAAAKAAVTVLAGGPPPTEVDVPLPSGPSLRVEVLYARAADDGRSAVAAVRKDAGDDPDVTDGVEVVATVSWERAGGVTLVAGEGVGRVTQPGLQISPGEPAINPVPRQMIAAAVRQASSRPLRVEIAIPGGRQIAAKTFNPRLGIEGGLSILGTTGIVRPYCTRALHDALKCSLDVAAACEIDYLVLVPGNIGARAAECHLTIRPRQLIELGNAWDFTLRQLREYGFRGLLLVGHPGKLVKLAAKQWDTHSAHSDRPTTLLAQLAAEVLHAPIPDCPTVEGMLAALPASERSTLAAEAARRIRQAVAQRLDGRMAVAVLLIDMAGSRLADDGDLTPWQ